ncbi:hypothetical protein CL656_05415 [bacterium]|nr:hypothetical protein [bacterium]|tara:strand:+ start:30 stop:257 length:228 start_codon:yes stop_codon:yes gene_type:complete
MNEYYYKYLINPFLELKDKQVLNRNLRYLIGLKKREKLKKHYIKIKIHSGVPCFRYCICYLMTDSDSDYLYKRYY